MEKHEKLTIKNNRAYDIASAFLLLCFAMLLMSLVKSSADEPTDLKFAKAGLYIGLKEAYSVLMWTALPIAAVCLASCGLQIWMGGERGMEKAKKSALYVVLGLVVVMMAPLTAKLTYDYLHGIMINVTTGATRDAMALPGVTDGNVNYISNTIYAILNFVAWIIPSLCAVSLAYGGMCFFGLDIMANLAMERQVEKGKTIIRTTIVAMFAFYILPLVIKTAINLFRDTGWMPRTSPNGGSSSLN